MDTIIKCTDIWITCKFCLHNKNKCNVEYAYFNLSIWESILKSNVCISKTSIEEMILEYLIQGNNYVKL